MSPVPSSLPCTGIWQRCQCVFSIGILLGLARIRFGDTLKVINGPFDVLVEVGKYRLTVLLKGRFVKESEKTMRKLKLGYTLEHKKEEDA